MRTQRVSPWLRLMILLALTSIVTPAWALDAPLSQPRQSFNVPELTKRCTHQTSRNEAQVFPTRQASTELPRRDHAIVSVEDQERLCLKFFEVGENEAMTVALTRSGEAADLIVTMEHHPRQPFTVLRIENLGPYTVQIYHTQAPSTWPLAAITPISGRSERLLTIPGRPQDIRLRFRATRWHEPADAHAGPSPSNVFEAELGFKLGVVYGQVVRPHKRLDAFLARSGFLPFPDSMTRIGGVLGLGVERVFIDGSLTIASGDTFHREDAERLLRMNEGALRVELALGLARFGVLVIAPYGGFGVNGVYWSEAESPAVFGLDSPHQVGTGEYLVSGGIDLGQLLPFNANEIHETGASFNLKLGFEQILARENWGYTPDAARVYLDRDPKLGSTTFVVTLTVGLARRALHWRPLK